jgi:hypothetical protein
MAGDGKPAPVKEELSDTRGPRAERAVDRDVAFRSATTVKTPPAEGRTGLLRLLQTGTSLQNLQLTPSMPPLCERDTIPAAGAGRARGRPCRKPDC